MPAVRFAQKAERIGADAVTVVGFECGGHPGMDDVTTLVLAPKAAGSGADARGLVAALALGAEGVVMGTRFVATTECLAHQNIKEWLVGAGEADTVIIQRSIRNAARVLRNEAAEKVLEMEVRGSSLEELLTLISGQAGREAMINGDTQGGIVPAGQCVGLINQIKPIKDVIEEMVGRAEAILNRLQNIMT